MVLVSFLHRERSQIFQIKFTRERFNDVTKFTRQLNVYGIGEELLFPITLNDRKSETNLATYLVKTKEFERTSVKISENAGKDSVKLIDFLNNFFPKINDFIIQDFLIIFIYSLRVQLNTL